MGVWRLCGKRHIAELVEIQSERSGVLISHTAIKPTAVEPREGHRIWLKYSDGSAGEVDLSHLAGIGVFASWNDRAVFAGVHITEYDAIAWSEELELCPDALYLQLTGKSLAELMPGAKAIPVDA